MTRYVLEQRAGLAEGHESALVTDLADGRPVRQRCTASQAARPAIVLGVDETTVWNLGFQHAALQRPQDEATALFDRWERSPVQPVEPVAGVADMLAAVRAAGVTVVFNTNRHTVSAPQTAAMLEAAGLSPARHLDTLFLKGNADGSDGEDGRRAAIAERFCVLAQAGDQMVDFSDLIDAADAGATRRPPAERRDLAASAFAPLRGAGWFMLPNPIYARWQPCLTLDNTIPQDKRWRPDDS